MSISLPFQLSPALFLALLAACGGVSKETEGSNPGECQDGADNDSDGDYDCGDADCVGSPDCTEDTDSGDADTDADTDTDTDADTDTDTDTDSGETNSAPSGVAITVEPTNPTDDDALACTVVTEAVDPDGDAVTYRFAWSVDGTDAGIVDADVSAALTSGGQTWTCTVTPTDGRLDGTPSRASVTIEATNQAPSAPVVSITPVYPLDDDTLECVLDTESRDPDGDTVTYTYAWRVNGVDAGLATSSVSSALTRVGQVWGCGVTASDGVATSTPGTASVEILDDPSVDTALGMLFYSGDAQTARGSFVDGDFGYTLYSMDFTEICLDQSQWSDTGAPTPPCPQCDWAFELALSGGTAIGSACAGIGLTGGEWDGFTAPWGFADTYIYDYSGTPYTFDLAVLYYSTSYGWGPLAYNYASYGYNTGDETDISFMRFYGYIYYYP